MSGSPWVIIIFVIVFGGGYAAIIRWEEGKLTGQFGGEYQGYFDCVPRILPMPRIWPDRQGTFSFGTMMRCMEPVKTAAFLAALVVMLYLKAHR